MGNFIPVALMTTGILKVMSHLYNIYGSYDTVTIIDFLDIIHHPIFYLKNVSETELCPHPQVKDLLSWAQSLDARTNTRLDTIYNPNTT